MGNEQSQSYHSKKDHNYETECLDLFKKVPDLEAFNHDLLSKKKISVSYANKLFGGSVAEVNPQNSQNDGMIVKSNPLIQEIKQFQIHKSYGGGLYSLKGALIEPNTLDPQNDFNLFVDIDILVDSVQVDQLRDVKRIIEIPINERQKNDTLLLNDVIDSINGYGRLVYYKLISKSMNFSSENCAIIKVQEGKFKQGLMHGFGREFDTSQAKGGVNVGYFKDGQPYVGRCEKFEMDEISLISVVSNNPIQKQVNQKEQRGEQTPGKPPVHPNDIGFSLRGSIIQNEQEDEKQKQMFSSQKIQKERSEVISDFNVGEAPSAFQPVIIQSVAKNEVNQSSSDEEEDHIHTSRQLIKKSEGSQKQNDSEKAQNQHEWIYADKIAASEKINENQLMVKFNQNFKAQLIKEPTIKEIMRERYLLKKKEFAKKIQDIEQMDKRATPGDGSEDYDEEEAYGNEESSDQETPFQTNYRQLRYSNTTLDELKYVHGKDDKIRKWPEHRRNKHVKALWRNAFAKASGVVKVINKTVECKEIRLRGGIDEANSEQEAINAAGKVQRATPIKFYHEKIFGQIPNQRQLAKRLKNKLLKRATVRKMGWNMFETFQTPKDIRKLGILDKFLEEEEFDNEDRKDINRLVKRNTYWDDQDLFEDEYVLIDETQILNHKYYDRMHYMLKRQEFLFSLNVVEEKGPEKYCCGLLTKKDPNERPKDHDELMEEEAKKENDLYVQEDLIPDKYTITKNCTFYLFWQVIIVIANVTTCIMYPTHTILSYNKTHDTYIEPQYVIDSRTIVNPHVFDDAPVFHISYNLGIFMTTLSNFELTLVFFECIFLVNICINFFVQENDDAKIPLRQPIIDVATRYLQGRFILDVIILLPIGYFLAAFYDVKFLFLLCLKGIRVVDLNSYISDKFLGPHIRSIFTWVRQSYAKSGGEENPYEDNLFIEREIYILNMQKICRMGIQLCFACYFFGVYWYVFSETLYIIYKEHEAFDPIINKFRGGFMEHHDTWVYYKDNWNIFEKDLKDSIIVNTYFALTTLSTVGFGDYYPVANTERVVGALLLYFGQAGFNFLVVQFLDVLDNIQMLDKDDDAGDELNKFLNTLHHFNNKFPMEKEFSDAVIDFFKYKSANDKNNFLLADIDQALFDSLPLELRKEIYTKFVYKKFLMQFSKFFALHKQCTDVNFRNKSNSQMDIIEQDNLALKTKIKTASQIKICGLEYPYFTFEDKDYSDCITSLFNILEVRKIQAKEQISEELEEANEVIFVEKGSYLMGFQINKKDYYSRKFKEGSIIQAFNVLYQCRSQYLIKASTDMNCQWIRKTSFIQLLLQYPSYMRAMKTNAIAYYNASIHQPLQKQKRIVMDELSKRKDLEYIIDTVDIRKDIILTCLKNDDQDIFERKEAFQYNEDCMKEIEYLEVSFEILTFYRLRITQKTEEFLKKFMNEMFFGALKQYRGMRQKKEIIKDLLQEGKELVLPFSLLNQDRQQTRFKNLTAYREYQSTQLLSRHMTQKNPFHKVKTKLLREGNYAFVQNRSDKYLIRRATMKKKFGRALTKITADIAAAPDLSDSNSDMGISVGPEDGQISVRCRHEGVERFGYEKEIWDQVEEEGKNGGTKYYIPDRIGDEQFDELYLAKQNKIFEPNLNYSVTFKSNKNLKRSFKESDSLVVSLTDNGSN